MNMSGENDHLFQTGSSPAVLRRTANLIVPTRRARQHINCLPEYSRELDERLFAVECVSREV
jgi:hypothetical protein